MEDNFRNALIIISAIVIAAIFIHGLWTIRKNKNPYKLKTSHTKVEPLTRDFDSSGFDQDGVSQPKVVTTALTGEIENPPLDEDIPNKPAPAPDFHEEPLPSDVERVESDASVDDALENEKASSRDDYVSSVNVSQSNLSQNSASKRNHSESDVPHSQPNAVYQAPVINAKPETQVNAGRSKARAQTAALKKNQIELDFEQANQFDNNRRKEPTIGGLDKTEHSTEKECSASEQQSSNHDHQLETEVIVLSVVMPENHLMSGAALLPTLLTLGMKYGDMNIFHRHQDNAGNGKVTFSLANMMNPGTFDLDNIENFTTQGVSLFMTLPNAGDPFEVFENMLAAAKQISQEFDAQLLDDKRSVMTKQTEQHYVSKIREFERKKRIITA